MRLELRGAPPRVERGTVNLIVIAKSPVAGSVKTRLTPPCAPEQAAALAEAALVDTLASVHEAASILGGRATLVLDGSPGAWLPDDVDVVPQRGRGLDERLAAAFEDVGGPAFLVGMDTPQLSPDTIVHAVRLLQDPGVDAVLGEADDGGWWAIGMRDADAAVFLGVPMSTRATCAEQRTRLARLGMRVRDLPRMRDVDTFDDAVAVARDVPGTRFAAAVANLELPATAGNDAERDGPGAPPRRGDGALGGRTLGVLMGGLVAIGLVHAWGRWLQAQGFRMRVNAPPLTGNVDPRFGLTAIPALTVAAGVVGGADRAARSLPWRRLLWASFAAALAWSAALAFWDALDGFTRSPASPVDYLAALPAVDGVGDLVRTLLTDARSLPAHVQAHPPGMVVALLGLERAGLATPGWLALVEHVAGAASVPAVLLAAREIAGERTARTVAPFLVASPIAVTWSSGDAVFLGVGAWAVTLFVLATGRAGRRSVTFALGGGALAAAAIFLSYGIVLLALVPIAVAWRRRRFDVLAIGAAPALAAVALAAAGGFWWFEGLEATRRAYALSLARVRPWWFFAIANLAAVLVAIGPAVWAGLAHLRDRGLWLLAGGALVAIAIADVSGLSRAEVERIWLPFLPWLVMAGAAAFTSSTSRGRRGWLAAQVGWALGVQMVVLSPW